MATRKIREIRVEGNVAYVPLSQGYEAIIDAADVPIVEGSNWSAMPLKRKDGTITHIYAVRQAMCDDGKRRLKLMHREVAGTAEGMDTDHKDGNGLNNRRANLRDATRSQNMCNQRRGRGNTSGVKGVCWSKAHQRWVVQIKINGKRRSRYRRTIEEAAAVYAECSAELHGEYGRTG